MRIRALAGALTIGIALGCVPVGAAAAADGPGSWSVTTTASNVRAVHVAVLDTGKVLLVAGSGNDPGNFSAGSFKTSQWDPTTGSLTTVSTPWDAFCSGHAFLPDGRLLVAGGTAAYPSAATNDTYAGTKQAYLFDPTTGKYTRTADMHVPRWYPTVTELGDGRQFVLGGQGASGERTDQWEIFDGSTWTQPAANPSRYVYQPEYPALHLLRDGHLFYSGVATFGSSTADTPAGIWDYATNAYRSVPGLVDDARRDQGASVMLPPAQDQRVMVIGGGDHVGPGNAVASTGIVDLKQVTPSYTTGPALDTAKMYVNAVILPDSTVFETGGATKSVLNGGTPVTSTQIYHPRTNRWTKAASATVPRVYHSSAVLLPDGRVATFGGNPPGSFEMRIEVYTPAYLQTGAARPVITGGPNEFRYGDYGAFTTTQSSPISSVVLVKPAATTHQSDPNQRLVDVPFTRTATGVSVTMPTEPNLAPPGWYMLFAVDANGVPSVAKWVHLQGGAPGTRGGYVLDGYGGLHGIGLNGSAAAPAVTQGPYWPGWDIARGVARRNRTTGYVVDGFGGLHRYASGTAALPPLPKGTPYWPGWDIVRGVALLPDGSGGYELDAFGGVHPFRIGGGAEPPAVRGAPYWPGQDRARGITLLNDGSGGYVVDSAGKLYPFRLGTGKAAVPAATPPAVLVPRGVAVQPNRAGGFVLDGNGALRGFPIAGGVPFGVRGVPTFAAPLARGVGF